MWNRLVWNCLAGALLAGAAAAAGVEGPPNLVGKAPPTIDIAAKEWLNTKGQVSLDALKGRVVWLEFGFIH